MNRDETLYWVNSLFPSEATLTSAGDVEFAAFTMGSESLVCTVGFGNTDTGLVTAGPDGAEIDVRCEIFSVATAEATVVAGAIQVATAKIVSERLHAQPGVFLADLALGEGTTLSHGVLMEPQVWGAQVPQVLEQEEWCSNPGRLTLPLQLLLLTEDEYAYAVTYGVPDLLQAMTDQGINSLDVTR